MQTVNRLLAQNAKDRVDWEDSLAQQNFWFSPSEMASGAKNALLAPVRNPGMIAELGLSLAPGSGEAMSARDAWDASGRASNALLSGNYGQAASEYGNVATGILGALPGAGIIARGTKRGAAWMDRNLPKGVNKLLDAAMPSDPANTMNIFAGPTAKTADRAALAKAQEMAGAGASRDDIWRDTGWFQGTDGKWRFEIDDSAAKIADENYLGGGITSFSKLDHPELYGSYGDIPEIGGVIEYGKRPSGAYSYSQKLLHKDEMDPARIDVTAGNRDDALSTSLHEVQHHAQAKEGFASGGTERNFTAKSKLQSALERARANGGLDPVTGDFDIAIEAQLRQAFDDPYEGYRRLAGEVEARNVQNRMNMSADERRAKAPWLTQDVPDDQQIVRYR